MAEYGKRKQPPAPPAEKRITLNEAHSNKYVWSRLIEKHPEIRYAAMPSTDELVVEFLARHDVHVRPAGSNINSSPLMSGIMGAAGGPLAVGINQGLTAQAKAAALQEWTSWKQWALSHSDWPEYKAKIEERHDRARIKASQLIAEPEIQSYLRNQLSINRRVPTMLVVIVCFAIAFLFAVASSLS